MCSSSIHFGPKGAFIGSTSRPKSILRGYMDACALIKSVSEREYLGFRVKGKCRTEQQFLETRRSVIKPLLKRTEAFPRPRLNTKPQLNPKSSGLKRQYKGPKTWYPPQQPYVVILGSPKHYSRPRGQSKKHRVSSRFQPQYIRVHLRSGLGFRV